MNELKWDADYLNSFNKIYIVACGTAYHAGLVGKFYIEKLARIPVEVDVASEFRYRDPIVDENTLLIVVSQSQQAQQREFRGLQAAALDHGGVGKVIPLKKVKAKRVAQLHLLVAFHFLGEDRFTQWLEIIYQLFEPIRGDAADIDLDNFSELEQRARLVERFWPFPDRQDVTCATQLLTASQHFRRRTYGFQNFQDY